MQTKNILITGCAENLENALCLLPDPFISIKFEEGIEKMYTWYKGQLK